MLIARIAITSPTATNTPATFPVEPQNEDDLSIVAVGRELSGVMLPGFETVVVGALGIKLVITTVVPGLTVFVGTE